MKCKINATLGGTVAILWKQKKNMRVTVLLVFNAIQLTVDSLGA